MFDHAGDLSRNRTVGLRLGKGESLPDITTTMGGQVAEGVLTSRSVYALAKKLGIDCPIMEGIYRVIHGASGSLCLWWAGAAHPSAHGT